MSRVKQVVQWAYDLDMHIILNSHHDETRILNFTDARTDQSIRTLTTFWEQIAREFNGYGDRLIFAGLNEPRIKDSTAEWTGGTPEIRENINKHNQAFVNTVRATGGNNANRFLIVPTHGASSENRAFEGFVIPKDTANDKIILAVHTYSPFGWAHDGNGSYEGADRIRRDLTRVNNNATRLGVPVVLSEWGSVNNGQADNLEQRVQHAADYIGIAREFGMATFWWDTGSTSSNRTHSFGLFNRRTGEKHFPTIIDSIIKAYQ
jgi:endoglucanase